MTPRFSFPRVSSRAVAAAATLLAAGLAVPAPAEAQGSRYLRLELGRSTNPGMTLDGTDNDWSTQCDLLINTAQVEVGDRCNTAPEPTGWSHDFSGGGGVVASLAAGWRITDRLRVEAEYSFLAAGYGDELAFRIGDVETQDKAEQEIEITEGAAQDLRGHAVFGNLYFDPFPYAKISPYVGVGVGAVDASLDYFVRWKRNDDPVHISTFEDPMLNARVAGTTTIGRSRLSDRLFGYQAVIGADYVPSDGQVALGVRARRADFASFEGSDEWLQLRSHESDVGRGERIRYTMTTDDLSFWSVAFSIRYGF